jgi:uncharacterized membrane protein
MSDESTTPALPEENLPSEVPNVEPVAETKEAEPAVEVVEEPAVETVSGEVKIAREAPSEASAEAPGAEEERAQVPVVEPFSVQNEPIPPPPISAEPTPEPSPPPPPFDVAQGKPAGEVLRQMLVRARAAFQERKRKKLDRILALLEEKNVITGGDVQKHLRVPKPTATRYLNQLEKEGKIIQVGVRGRGVRYVRR